MKLITVNDDKFLIRGTVSVDKVTISTNELKNQYSLADAGLRNGDVFYICMKVLEGEFKDIK